MKNKVSQLTKLIKSSKNSRLIDNDKLKKNARTRAMMLKCIRNFFDEKGFLEVDTPLLDICPSMEPAISAFDSIFYNGANKHKMYLQSSPEYNMKKLLVSGFDRIFQITKSFRNNELTKLHNPEFTILEWYRTGSDYNQIMRDTEELVATICEKLTGGTKIKYFDHPLDLSLSYDKLSVNDAFKTFAGIDLNSITNEHYYDILSSRGLCTSKEDSDFNTFFYYIFVNEIEPRLGFNKPVFLIDFPEALGSLARRKTDDGRYVERFELYINGLEICNAFSELNDYEEQKARFAKELEKRSASGIEEYPIDQDFLSFLEYGMPPAGGIALGVDRLLMLFADTRNINDVILFPFAMMKDFVENV